MPAAGRRFVDLRWLSQTDPDVVDQLNAFRSDDPDRLRRGPGDPGPRGRGGSAQAGPRAHPGRQQQRGADRPGPGPDRGRVRPARDEQLRHRRMPVPEQRTARPTRGPTSTPTGRSSKWSTTQYRPVPDGTPGQKVLITEPGRTSRSRSSATRSATWSRWRPPLPVREPAAPRGPDRRPGGRRVLGRRRADASPDGHDGPEPRASNTSSSPRVAGGPDRPVPALDPPGAVPGRTRIWTTPGPSGRRARPARVRRPVRSTSRSSPALGPDPATGQVPSDDLPGRRTGRAGFARMIRPRPTSV